MMHANVASWVEPRTRRARRLTVAAMFSLDPAPDSGGAPLERASARAARELDRALPSGGVALLTGPSGSGKSSVVRALAARLRGRHVPIIAVASSASLQAERRTPIDLLDGRLHDDLRLLCAVGLAEAPVWTRPARLLSDGQRARLALAVALGKARRRVRPVLLADEFASTLDRVTAMTLCLGVRRLLLDHPDLRLVLASAHDDLTQWLTPDVALRVHAGFAHHGRFDLSMGKGRAAP